MKTRPTESSFVQKIFQSIKEIDRGIAKLEKRKNELESMNIRDAYINGTGALEAASFNIEESVRDIFGTNSPEMKEIDDSYLLGYLANLDMPDRIQKLTINRNRLISVIEILIERLKESRFELELNEGQSPSTYFDQLKLHQRIVDVSRELFMDGHPSQAVFDASKALVNYVKERSGKHELDGSPLMTTVFSRNDPILAFDDLKDKTGQDIQEGMMHLFMGVVLAIRNPGGHSFPEDNERRAIEYISLISMLAYRLQDAKKVKTV